MPPVIGSDLNKHSVKVDSSKRKLDVSSDFENDSKFEDDIDDSGPFDRSKTFFQLIKKSESDAKKNGICSIFLEVEQRGGPQNLCPSQAKKYF